MTPLFKKKNLFSNVILLWQNDLENYHHFQLHAHSHRPCQSWPQNRAYFLVSNKWHSIKILMKDKKWLRIFFIIRLITVFLRSFSFKFTMLLFVAHSLSLSIIAFFQPKKKKGGYLDYLIQICLWSWQLLNNFTLKYIGAIFATLISKGMHSIVKCKYFRSVE